ncbi:MAG: class I SAM-dependent methyltransferase, partial [Oscillospiraceae bacterium]
PGQSILDLGCGAGRDSKYFLEQGFSVTAVDGSPTLCQYASKLTGITVSCLRFEDLDQESCFHGIWACASLLHVAKKEMPAIIRKVNRALISQGILFTCFKYGEDEYEKNGRFFSNYNEETIKAILNPQTGFVILETFITGDVRKDRQGERWLNVVARKMG